MVWTEIWKHNINVIWNSWFVKRSVLLTVDNAFHPTSPQPPLKFNFNIRVEITTERFELEPLKTMYQLLQKHIQKNHMSQDRNWISDVICHGVFRDKRVQLYERWLFVLLILAELLNVTVSCCWFWWNRWPFLFKFSFHNTRHHLTFYILSNLPYL